MQISKFKKPLFLKAANNGDAESARYLGMIFILGKGVTNYKLAKSNLEKLKGVLGRRKIFSSDIFLFARYPGCKYKFSNSERWQSGRMRWFAKPVRS